MTPELGPGLTPEPWSRVRAQDSGSGTGTTQEGYTPEYHNWTILPQTDVNYYIQQIQRQI